MVDFELKIHEKQGTMYVPKEIRQALGLEVKATPNRKTVFLYPKNMAIKDVVKSLDIIKEDLEHGIELQKEVRVDEQS
jgi:bifunctional DNA-binding transcriptional regulator/antitoxin component of YhaV-PrlF toxin-antitoxin module